MLRIHFTEKDLTLLELSSGAEPMWEVLMSSYRLRRPEGRQLFGRWRQAALGLLSPSDRALLDLIPAYGYCPDFLTPAEACTDIRDGMDALAGTPPTRINTDLSELATWHSVPTWPHRVADGDSRALRELSRAIGSYYRRCVEPHWQHISRTVARDRARRADALLTGGPAHLLATLHPAVRWRPPVLEVKFPVDQDLHLNGRGLRLIPSFFCMGMPTTYKNPDLPPVLVYSIGPRAPLGAEQGRRDPIADNDALAALIGETRGRILRTIAGGDCNTTELSRRTHTSPATASQHASVLRSNGLIESHQRGKSTMHTVTPLGLRLLLGSPDDHR